MRRGEHTATVRPGGANPTPCHAAESAVIKDGERGPRLLAVLAAALCAAVALLSWFAYDRLRADSVPEPAPADGVDSLSVVVAARDEEPRIGALLATLLAQDHPDFEIIVVDD